ncbi:ABC transporter substrate-binding protein [Ureibacillus acetophenoni]|uniref:Amino acid/amide ABC transporter substrate-binding protein (HAAT family) n=1 Tax=Ureibacillus acetophenoni TaxID=614649 RepID=A0A285UBN7_9BACL|nr:ABC transporter substrate-binding protein [Ureibacillus acetophenoni]SOC39242.1 amino acid/amide ABC transporter substrate-binding protein (HAAT family) [Ureibacillus acetophenoni]
MRKNKLKRFASIFLATSLVVGALAGCSSGGSSGGSSSSDNSDVIKIGANLELTGQVASYGSSILAGAELAVEEINANGGIDGKKIELIKADNKSDNAEAASSAIKLITQDKVVAMVGPATSGNMLATVQTANKYKVPVVTGSGTAENLTVNDDGSINDYIFRTCFIDPFQGVSAANFAINELGAKNIAIYADNSSDYAKGLAKSFKEQVEKNGGTIVTEEAYVAKDVDFKSTLTNIKSENPDFIYIPGYYEEVGLIVKQARELGIDVPLMGADGWGAPTLLELAGAEPLNNTYYTDAFSLQDPDEMIQNFIKAFEDKNGEKPNGFNALGYDTVYFIADAIERAGSTDGEAIKNALESTKDFKVVTGTFSVDEKHNPIKSATIIEYVDGEQVFNSKVNP